jgi:hypothetical protein
MHMEAVRRLRGLESSRIVFCAESNLAFEGKRIAADLARERVREVYCIREDKKDEGIRTTELLKKEMAIAMNALLLQNRLMFHRQMVCVSNDPNEAEQHTPSSMRKLIIDQLDAYSRELVPNRSNTDLPNKEKYTGKRSGADDHASKRDCNNRVSLTFVWRTTVALQICWMAKEKWEGNKEFYSRMRPLFDDSNLA